MNPADFLPVAERYQNSPIEAERRTSIGRSYYGVFKVLVGKLSTKGVGFHESQDDHRLLAKYFKSSGNSSGYKIGQKLENLRKLRNDSDYKMSIVISAENSRLAYLLAKQMLDTFDQLSPEALAKIVQEMDNLR